MKIFIDLDVFTEDTLEISLKQYSDFGKFYAFEPFELCIIEKSIF